MTARILPFPPIGEDHPLPGRDVWAEINARPSKLRPFGSALHGGDGGHVERCPIIGRTIKPHAAGPCKVCGERRWFCDCDNGEAA